MFLKLSVSCVIKHIFETMAKEMMEIKKVMTVKVDQSKEETATRIIEVTTNKCLGTNRIMVGMVTLNEMMAMETE